MFGLFREAVRQCAGFAWQAIAAMSAKLGCAVGSSLSRADITIYYWLTFFYDNTEGAKAAYASCPNIAAIVSETAANAKVKEWEAKRPVSMF